MSGRILEGREVIRDGFYSFERIEYERYLKLYSSQHKILSTDKNEHNENGRLKKKFWNFDKTYEFIFCKCLSKNQLFVFTLYFLII